MEWYFGSAEEDVIVPKHEMFDGLPSSDNWSSWLNIVGNYNSQKKVNASQVEELFSEPMFSRSSSRQQSASQQSDYQLNDLPKIEEADDIFFDSLFKGDAGDFEESESSAQTSNWNDVMAIDFNNHVRDNTNDVSSCDFPSQQELEAEICMLEGQSDLSGDISEYISMDEPVLLELQNLTHQLADTTRACFRDSLYRLAENSRYQTKCSQIGKENLENHKPISRVGPSGSQESRSSDSDTKSIDRTVATMLFTTNTMNFCNSTSPTTSGLDGEREYQTNSRWYHPCNSPAPPLCTLPGGDAEVPTFDSMMNQPLPRSTQISFSTTPIKGS